eukprot:scaffold51948_cov30-Attheya_sp.AAC.2
MAIVTECIDTGCLHSLDTGFQGRNFDLQGRKPCWTFHFWIVPGPDASPVGSSSVSPTRVKSDIFVGIDPIRDGICHTRDCAILVSSGHPRVGNIQHPSTKSSVQSYRAQVPAYGQQQQQMPMAEMNPPRQRRPGRSWHSTRVPRPDPLIDELQGLYQKQAGERHQVSTELQNSSSYYYDYNKPNALQRAADTHNGTCEPARPARTPTTPRYRL